MRHGFTNKSQLAWMELVLKCMKTHSRLFLRTPEPTSMACCKDFNTETVMALFDIS